MKKILLFILLLFIGFSYGYSQYVPIQIVTEYDDPFLRYLPLNQMVYCKDSDAVYMLDIPAFPISKLSTTANHRVIGFTLDTTGFVMWTDTLVLIATKHDLDTLSNSVYDSLSNHYDLIHALDTGKVSTSGDIMYGDLEVNAEISATDTIKAPYIKITNQYTLPTTDGTIGQGIVTDGAGTLTWGMSFDSLKCYTKLFMDTVESCINQLYLKADTTTISSFFKLKKYTNNNTKPVLGLVSTGRIDTIPVVNITDDYVLNSGDNLNGTYDIQTGGLIITPLANATGDKVIIIHESGVIDTAKTITLETASINYITLVDSLTINGVTTYQYGGNILDDGLILFPANSFGHGTAYVYNAGMYVEYAEFILNIDGTYILQRNSGNVVNSNVDGNVCLYTNMIQNRLGGTRYFIITLYKN